MLILSAWLTGCSSKEPAPQPAGDITGQDIELSPTDEKKMMAEIYPVMRDDYPAFQNPKVQSYINNLGNKIARANGMTGAAFKYYFIAVNTSNVTSFSLPGGAVFISLPLIALANNEAELAGIISHEIGHMKARHIAERLEMEREVNGQTTWQAGRAATDSTMLVDRYDFMVSSPREESEADRLGFNIAISAGYNKEYVGQLVARLREMENKAKKRPAKGNNALTALSDYSSAHFLSAERVDYLRLLEVESPPPLPNAIISTKEFDQVRAICRSALNAPKKK